jgi:hypothetical protein
MSRPPLPSVLAVLRRSVARHDYRPLRCADTERLLFSYARRIGIGPAELLREWQGSTDFAAALGTQPEAPARDDEDEPEEPMDDLGPEPKDPEDDPEEDDDEEDEAEDEQQMQTCPTCRGKGRDHSGKTCSQCNGSGRIPLPSADDEDDGDDDEKDEFESLRYEFEDEE